MNKHIWKFEDPAGRGRCAAFKGKQDVKISCEKGGKENGK